MWEISLLILVGLGLLLSGGELLVRGAVQAASRLGVSPLVIGLTLVGFGTSMPELVTSVQAGLRGAPGIAYGNVVGSNIANILLIAGVSAVVYPIVVARSALRRDAMVMLAVAVMFTSVAAVAPMGRAVGLAMITLLAGYIVFVILHERQRTSHGALHDKGQAHLGTNPNLAPLSQTGTPLVRSLLIAFVGLVLVVIGGTALVKGAVALARGFEVSESVIGLTIVAVGTSTPELVTSVIAAIKRQGDVAFGNVVGSNIYNILGISGSTALLAPSNLPPEILHFDAPVMIAVSVLFVLFAATGLRVGRREGALLLAGYAAYAWALWP